MNPNTHERAWGLIDALLVEGIATSESEWLEAHLANCPGCQVKARANERALQVLRSNGLAVRPTLVSMTQARVRLRARELHENQSRMRALWISSALSWVLGVASAPFVWRAFQWIGLHAGLPKPIWGTAFALWWLLPAGAVAVLIAWNQRRTANQNSLTTLLR